MKYGPTDPSYWGPNGEMPTHLQALAEACERAADEADKRATELAIKFCGKHTFPRDEDGERMAMEYIATSQRDAATIRHHAAALRAGRVTVAHEGGDDGR